MSYKSKRGGLEGPQQSLAQSPHFTDEETEVQRQPAQDPITTGRTWSCRCLNTPLFHCEKEHRNRIGNPTLKNEQLCNLIRSNTGMFQETNGCWLEPEVGGAEEHFPGPSPHVMGRWTLIPVSLEFCWWRRKREEPDPKKHSKVI